MMSAQEYLSGELPPTEEFLQQLRQAEEQYDPVEKLLSLGRELAQLEQKHNLTSADMQRSYEAGEVGDSIEFVSWYGRYKQYLELKRMISSSLELVLSGSDAALA